MPVSQFQGYVDAIDTHSGIIRGWAINLRNPLQPVRLHVVMDGQEVMQALCDLPREDVRSTLHTPSEKLGFQFTLPPAALDEQPHEISLRFADRSALPFPDGQDPNETRDVISFIHSSQIEYRSCVDGLHEGLLRGWVVARKRPNESWTGNVIVSVKADGLSLGTFRANHYRGDVVEALQCEPNCGFEVPIPQQFHDGIPHNFSVTSIPDNVPLAGSPLITALVDDQLAAKLVQIENTIASLHTQLTALRRETHNLIPKRPLNLQHYDRWARRYYTHLSEQTALQRQAHPLKDTPLISVLCPTWRPDEGDFRAAVDSVLAQTYQQWELIIVDDGSACPRTTKLIQDYCKSDKRIRSVVLPKNQGIAGATNAAIKAARGAYIAFFDHDDLLVDVALERMIRTALTTGAKLLYCDEDKIDAAGHFLEPNLKPDYDYRYLLGCNYICHLTVMEAELVRKIGPLEGQYNGAQDHDFLLRAVELIPREAIHHVPDILYHWRKTPNSTASNIGNKSYAVKAGTDCVAAHLHRRKIKANVSSIDRLSLYAIQWPFRKQPSISIIIPFRDQLEMTRNCVDSLLTSQKYRKFEIILVDNFSVEKATLSWLESIQRHKQVSVLRVEEPFNYARLNNLAARQSKSDQLLFLNNDVIITQPDFLTHMVHETLASPTVGAVGARLLYPNGTIQHAGVAVGPDVIGVHVHRLQPNTDFGYIGRIRLPHEVTAVTGAALMVPRTLFEELDGFDETYLAVAYNDVDLCLKIRASGHTIIYCAMAEAVHHESYSRGSDDRPEHEARFFHEKQVMLERWKENLLFKNDPAYPHYFRQDLRTFFDLRNPEDL